MSTWFPCRLITPQGRSVHHSPLLPWYLRPRMKQVAASMSSVQVGFLLAFLSIPTVLLLGVCDGCGVGGASQKTVCVESGG